MKGGNSKLKKTAKKKNKAFFSSIKKNKLYSFISIFFIFFAIPITVIFSLYKTNILNFAAGGSNYISGTVFFDSNGDGQWDNGEQAYPSSNQSITLTGNNGSSFHANVSASGGYTFYNLPAGLYTIKPSFQATNSLSAVTVPPSNGSVNIGYNPAGGKGGTYISGTVFNDTNGNGQWDNGEKPANTVNGSISLVGSNGKTVQTSSVTSNGGYGFYNIPSDTYSLKPSFQTTSTSLGGIKVPPSNTGVNIGFNASSGSNGGGNYISGTVFFDLNGDGQWDNGEKAAIGVNQPISLADTNGKTMQTVNVTANGGYGFYNLSAGTYIVKPSFSATNQSALQNIKTSNGSVNIGYNPGGGQGGNIISGTVFNDTNNNGIWDSGEQSANNINQSVSLVGSTGKTVQSTGITTNGQFAFYNVSAGTYSVSPSFIPTNQSGLQGITVPGTNNKVNIGYSGGNNSNGAGPGNTGSGNNSGFGSQSSSAPGSGVICSGTSNHQCSFSSSCSTEGQTCQCADSGWANHDKVYFCSGGNWQYQSETSNFICTEKCQ